MKRLLPLLLVLALLLTLCLSGCQEGTTPRIEETTTTSTQLPSDDTPSGDTPSGDTPSGDTPNGDTPNGDTPSGDTPSGDTPSGDTPSGDTPSGDTPSGDTPSGDTPSGDTPSGDTPSGDPSTCDHTDKDNNDLCDDCNVSVVIVLDLFAINDLHGKFCDSTTQIGVDEMTTYFKQAYQTEDYVLILSSGDMWQGSSESNLTKGQIVTEWMNEIDIVSMTLGNHEYDWGEEFIAQNAELAEFPFLAINVYDADTNRLVEYCQPSVLVERGGATIGIIGAIGDCYSSISGEMSGGVYFKTGDELTALVKAESQKLRDAGADFIVYSIHDGYGRSSSSVGTITNSNLRSYYDPTLSNGYVDIVFEGHSHQNYVLRDAYGVYHLQGGGDNKGITHAEAVINFANGQSRVQTAQFVASSTYEDLADDPIVDTLMEKYEEQVSEGLRVLGTNDFVRDSDYLRQLVADLYLQAGIEAFGNDYNIVLGGGYLSVRSPYSLAAGGVTYGQLQMLFPFDNDLVLCSIKGSDLQSRFINTTNSDYFMGYSDYGKAVKGNIDPNATYYVIVDTYSSTYAPNRLTEVARYTRGVYARDLLADYIEAGGLTSGQTEITYTSISEILQIGESLADNAQTDEGYYVKGVVSSVNNTTYGNLYLRDANGNELYVYGVYDATGQVRYDAMSNPPKVGDEIVLFAPVKRYVRNGTVTIELISARLITE